MPSLRPLPFALLLLGSALAVFALESVPPPAVSVTNDFVRAQFGHNCKLSDEVAPQTGDLDGDGVEDVVIAARCTDPMFDQGDHNYKVIDPYFSFAGYGDPRVTTQYSTEMPENRNRSLLIIHGFGAEAWRSSTPKQKFLVVNLPYREISVKRMRWKKKVIMAIYVLENGSDPLTSAVFWDGKKYRYVPMGGSLE